MNIDFRESVVKCKAICDYKASNNPNIVITKDDVIMSYGALEDESGLFYSKNMERFFTINEDRLLDFFNCLHLDYSENENVEDTVEISQYIRENFKIDDSGTYEKYESHIPSNAFGFMVKVEDYSFGEMIGILRYKKGWTLEELADKAFTTKQTISNIESGKARNPKREMVYGILLAFKLPYKDFVRYLQYAGMTFDKSNPFDLVVKKCVEDGVYDMQRINMYLEENGIEPYGYKFYNKE